MKYIVEIKEKTGEALGRLSEHYETLEVSQIIQKAIMLLDQVIQERKKKDAKAKDT